jgi:predicted phage terminase large subunit-like protein
MLEPNGQIISIGTRWHEGDIHKYLQGLSNYVSKTYKAIINEDTKNVLWPEQWPYEELLKRKAGMGSIGFEMQYQNEIVSTEDSPVKREWIENSVENYNQVMKEINKTGGSFQSFMGVDLASKGEESDFFTITVIGINRGNVFVIDGLKTKASLFKQFELIKSFDNKWTPARIGVEQAAQQKMIVDQLTESTTLPIIPIKSSIVNDRMSRVQRLSVLFETGRIYLNPNLTDWINELIYFPRGSNDDTIDSLSFALQAAQQDEENQVDWNAIKDMISLSKGKSVGSKPDVEKYRITKI